MLLNPFNNLSDHSKIWVYCFHETLTEFQLNEIRSKIETFTQNWTAHNNQLTAKGCLLLNHLIVLAVDEEKSSASGCSIDKSIHFLKTLMLDYNIDLFNRNLMAIYTNNNVSFIELSTLKAMLANNQMDAGQLYFDNTIHTLGLLRTKWLKPLHESWFYSQVSI